ncbi:MAG: GNAT family N-acetyltransferase [Spirochaetaceae bacterium]|jgi:ribosomal protein S18 acetylase RimI-like enzyme|nr:GNAT family N-acetyltransferase [Spirochaetaceae bacterium]
MEIRRAIDLGENIREKISELFVDAYGKDLQFFSKDKNRLIRAFAHMFVTEYFYMAIIDNEAAGMTVCIDQEHFCIKHSGKILVKHLGIIKGLAAHVLFKHYFNRYPKYPMELDERTASVEFVATRTEYRKRGVASTIIKHLLTLPEYKNYVLEVADTNAGAFKLYQKLGFRETCRKELKFGKKYAGINAFVYMEYAKE